ncbi:UNVERIFIED_CONTAM: hypothetical protein NCL1_19070 [Trichonephila clavipes]
MHPIIQFIILITYMGTDILTGCDYKTVIEYTLFAFLISLLVMFLNFYINSFSNKKMVKKS